MHYFLLIFGLILVQESVAREVEVLLDNFHEEKIPIQPVTLAEEERNNEKIDLEIGRSMIFRGKAYEDRNNFTRINFYYEGVNGSVRVERLELKVFDAGAKVEISFIWGKDEPPGFHGETEIIEFKGREEGEYKDKNDKDFDIRIHFADKGFQIFDKTHLGIIGHDIVDVDGQQSIFPYTGPHPDDVPEYIPPNKIGSVKIVEYIELNRLQVVGKEYGMPYVASFPENYLKPFDTVHIWAICHGDFYIDFIGDEDMSLLRIWISFKFGALARMLLGYWVKDEPGKDTLGIYEIRNEKPLNPEIPIPIEPIEEIKKGQSFDLAITMKPRGYELRFDDPEGKNPKSHLKEYNGLDHFPHKVDFQSNRPYMLIFNGSLEILNLEVQKCADSTNFKCG